MTGLASSTVYVVMDGSAVIALFSTPAVAHEWIQQQRQAAKPSSHLRAKAYTIQERQVWHVLPGEAIT